MYCKMLGDNQPYHNVLRLSHVLSNVGHLQIHVVQNCYVCDTLTNTDTYHRVQEEKGVNLESEVYGDQKEILDQLAHLDLRENKD